MTFLVTTGLTTITQDTELLTGSERYPIIGDAVSEDDVASLFTSFRNLRKYWDCLGKAYRAQNFLGKRRVMLGSLLVVSGDWKSEYGYYWNPPFEFHAWLDLGSGAIFDAALPGVIEKGLTTRDSVGPYIVDREPVVLAGPPLSWMKYRPVEEFWIQVGKDERFNK